MFYKLFPRVYRKRIEEMILSSGMKTTSEKYINKSFLISVIVAFLLSLFIKVYALPIFIGVFIGMFFMFNAWLILAIDKRKNFVEKVLPDALELMAANIRAGFIPSKALILSARPEFGPLAEAIKKSGKEIMTGKSLSEGLKEIPKYIRSEVLKNTVKLISEGSTAGGQLVALLEENAMDIRRKHAIQKEVKANIMMYSIFIVFAGIIGAPILYALSIHLITTLSMFSASQTTIPSTFSQSVPFFGMNIEISPDFLLGFSIASILITAFFSGIIIGLIDTGRERGGLKYVPIFIAVSLLIFFGARFFITNMFSGFLPG
jgi:Flp pilus assembly protein TadB